MSKTIPAGLAAYIASDAASLITCWKIQRRDGVIMGFTEWTEDIVVSGVTYKAATGYTATSVSQRADLSVPNLSVQGILDSSAITAVDMRGGKYDNAKLWIFLVNPLDIGAGIIKLRYGRLGQVELRDGQHTTEVRGLAQLLTTNFIEVFTSDCQADYGDIRCGKDLTSLTDTGTVTSISTQRRVFVGSMSTGRTADFYDLGLLSWTSGNNNGFDMEVKTWDGTNFTLYLPMGFDIQVGDHFTAQQGCPKTFAACKARNIVENFRGFPDIPGLDKMFIFPSQN